MRGLILTPVLIYNAPMPLGAWILCPLMLIMSAPSFFAENGSFMKPTLIVNATNDMRVAQEEIFGPVAVVIKFKTEEEVIAMANDSVYGLGGAVWTRDINRAIRVARGVETGRMWVNTYNQIPSGAPFGGYKESGLGREGGIYGMLEFTQQKALFDTGD